MIEAMAQRMRANIKNLKDFGKRKQKKNKRRKKKEEINLVTNENETVSSLGFFFSHFFFLNLNVLCLSVCLSVCLSCLKVVLMYNMYVRVYGFESICVLRFCFGMCSKKMKKKTKKKF